MKKALLIHYKNFSHIHKNVHEQFIRWFPEYEIKTFDVNSLSKKFSTLHKLINFFYFLKEYGFDYILRSKRLSQLQGYFKTTSYYNRLYTKIINEYVISENFIFTFQLQTLFNGKTNGIPHFIYTDHITIANNTYPNINPKEYIRSKEFIKMEKTLCQNSTLCFTMSTNISSLMEKGYDVNPENIKCIYVGSNVKIIQSNHKVDKYNNKNILFVGLDWKRKGGPILVSAFKKILNEVPDTQLTIVGCNPRIKVKNVKVMGKVPLDDVPAFYENASIFCLPTLREPFGIVFIEAMHYSLPVVSNNIGALPDIVINGNNGYLANNNADEIAKYLIMLLKDPDLCATMGKNGYNLVENQYSWDKVGELIRLYIEHNLQNI